MHSNSKFHSLAMPVIILVTWLACITSSDAIPSRPEPPRLVNDYAGILSSAQVQKLESVLTAFDDSTSNQIAIVTTTDLEGYEIAEYATRIGLEWQVGSSKFDNGIVLVVKPKTDRGPGQVFIAVGYGLEGAIPDIYAKRIINNELIPHFVSNDYYGGIASACSVLMKLASGEISEPRSDDEESVEAMIAAFVTMLIVIIVLAVIFGNGNSGSNGNGGRRPVIYTGPIITTGRNYGGFGGGGFGGFGGFGGGSFGGGGAGGSW